MIDHATKLLEIDDITIPRSTSEFVKWVDDKCEEIANNVEVKKDALLHSGIYKEFYEEILPLRYFVEHAFDSSSNSICIPNLGDEDFDAVIIDKSVVPPIKQKVEITCASQNYEENLRMEFLLQNGHVSSWGPLSVTGTKKTGHKIQVESECIEHEAHLALALSSIKRAIKGKSIRHETDSRYNDGHILIIAFDDWQWFSTKDHDKTCKFIRQAITEIQLYFPAIYLIGLSGKTFLPFEVCEENNH